MRIGTAIFFILILSCPQMGTRAFLVFRKSQIRREVETRIQGEEMEESEVVTLSFSKKDAETEPRWEHSREFEFRGEMYDVIKADTVGDTIYYQCFWDKAETEVNRQLEYLATHDSAAQNALSQYFIFLKNLFVSPQNGVDTTPDRPQATVHFHLLKKCEFPIAPPSPPPKVRFHA